MRHTLIIAILTLLIACGTDPISARDATGDVAVDTSTVDGTAGDGGSADDASDTAEDVDEDPDDDPLTDPFVDPPMDVDAPDGDDTELDSGEDSEVRPDTDGDSADAPDPPDTADVWDPPPTCSSDSECELDEYCDGCARGSCPGCLDCVSGCLPHDCATGDMPTCRALRPDCGDTGVAIVVDGCWQCVERSTCERVPRVSDCEASGNTCYARDGCPDGTERVRSSCEPSGGICCADAGRDTSCDDGGPLECDALEPDCERGSLATIQEGCWACVNPLTCKEWGEPGCETDRDCEEGEVCDRCATGSCPFCEDCVAACMPDRRTP